MCSSDLKMGLTNQLLDRFTALSIIQQLIVTKQAQILAMGVYTATGFTSGHAVTVYAYDGVNKQFQLYDNRFPGEVVTVPWDWANGFGSTSKKDTFNLYGFASFNSAYAPSTLAYFYGEAEAGFPASHYPSINLSTPSKLLATATYEVSADTNVLIEGAVARPADATNPTAQRYLHVYLNGTWQPNPVAISQANDTFQYTIPQLPNAAGTDVMLFVSERAQPFANGLPAWAGGFHAFKQFKLKLANQSFFTNLGFESGDFTSWVSERHTWGSTTSQVIPSDKSGIVSGADAIATSLTVPLFGKYAARVNNEDSGYHISTLTQTAVVPATKNPVVKFYWAAVLEDPNHPDAHQPYVEVTLVNQSKGNQVIYKQRFFSDDPAYSGWVSYRSGQWKSIPWQAVEVPVAAYVGDTLVLKVEAADCAQGAHGGYVYVDADD